MNGKHVAFVLESSYGHIVPTVGIATELISRGYRVSYAVDKKFEKHLRAIGAEVKVYRPLYNKGRFLRELDAKSYKEPGWSKALHSRWLELRQAEVNDTMNQLGRSYADSQPDLVVYDCMNSAGRLIANELGIRAAEHSPMMIDREQSFWSYDQELVLVSIPKFFQRDADELDQQFKFVGFVQNDRTKFFGPWIPYASNKPIVLVFSTTGLLPQLEFYKRAISAFEGSNWKMIITIDDEQILEAIQPLPYNCEVNTSFSNFEILRHSDVVVGQGGQGSVLEALYRGVPQILLPPTPVHEECAKRVAELGLGVLIDDRDATTANLREAAESLHHDANLRFRLESIAANMQESNCASSAADLIDQHL